MNKTVGFGEVSPKVRLTYVNGMRTSSTEACAHATRISELHGNTNAHYTYNASHGGPLDLLECVMGKAGISHHPVRLLKKNWLERIDEMGGVKGGGKIIHSADSQGAIITHCALGLLNSDQKRMIHVTTFGGAHMISNKDCGGAVNYVSCRDIVPFITASSGMLNSDTDVQFVGKLFEGAPFIDHGFMNKNYQESLQGTALDFVDKYGKVSP